jgi:hypothetical protein
VDLAPFVNVGLENGATPGVMAWTNEGDNDLRNLPVGKQRWHAVDVQIIDPRRNAGKAVIALSGTRLDGLPASILVPVDRTCGGFYALHALGRGRTGPVGWYDLVYADGSEHRIPLSNGREIANWWGPGPLGGDHSPAGVGRIAWRGPNPTCPDVGLYLAGFDNPHPGKRVVAIRLTAEGPVKLMVAALTLCEGRARFPRGIRSFGLPGIWSQAAIYHAITEGLGGVIDTDRAFASAEVRPRWAATEAGEASVCLHYPASDGYCAYTWTHDARRRTVILDVTGSGDRFVLRVLMPKARKPVSATADGVPVTVASERCEKSLYAIIELPSLPRGPVQIRY